MNDKVSVESFRKMTSLKTLVLSTFVAISGGCWGILEKKFIESLPTFKNIKCLAIDFNYQWITEKTIKALETLESLKVLNISKNLLTLGGNGLTAKDISFLKNKNLHTLICYNNPFNVD